MNIGDLNRFSSHSSQSVSSGHRVFYNIPDKPADEPGDDTTNYVDDKNVNNPKLDNVVNTHYNDFFAYIEKNIIGRDKGFRGPFGDRLILYCDYTASGRSLKFIEEFIYNEVLPEYANTHTTNTVTSLQTTMFRHEARDIIRKCCQASDQDAVIFVGYGCTGAIHKLIHNLNLVKAPIVIVGPFEHHSNLLPWRRLAHSIHRVQINSDGGLDINHLESILKDQSSLAVKEERPLIGTFAAVSNVTGIISDVNTISALMHRHHGLVFWDYATGAPYLPIDMNPVINGDDRDIVYKDAIYFSMHKFIGGVQSPGVLIAKRVLFNAGEVFPEGAGGGTVFFVRRENQIYLKDTEEREEGGTPDIVGSIRAGLAFQLKDAVTTDAIVKRENYLVKLAWSRLSDASPNLIVLGGSQMHRIPIFSILIRHEIRPNEFLFLHHNFVCSLLNDLFGIQSRSGCACAGPYALDLIGIKEGMAQIFENALVGNGMEQTVLSKYFEYPHREILRPGFVRINLPYYMPDAEVRFVLDSIKFVAKNGYKFLPLYKFNPVTSEWRHREHEMFRERKWISHISYKRGYMTWKRPNVQSTVKYPFDFSNIMKEAREKMEEIIKTPIEILDESLDFDKSVQTLRWFLLPSEVATILWKAPAIAFQSKAEFIPGSIVKVFIGSGKTHKPVTTVTTEAMKHEVVEEFKETTERKLFTDDINQNSTSLWSGSTSKECVLRNNYLKVGYVGENESENNCNAAKILEVTGEVQRPREMFRIHTNDETDRDGSSVNLEVPLIDRNNSHCFSDSSLEISNVVYDPIGDLQQQIISKVVLCNKMNYSHQYKSVNRTGAIRVIVKKEYGDEQIANSQYQGPFICINAKSMYFVIGTDGSRNGLSLEDSFIDKLRSTKLGPDRYHNRILTTLKEIYIITINEALGVDRISRSFLSTASFCSDPLDIIPAEVSIKRDFTTNLGDIYQKERPSKDHIKKVCTQISGCQYSDRTAEMLTGLVKINNRMKSYAIS